MMNREDVKDYKVEIEVNILRNVEFLNLCMKNGIYLSNVKKINKATMSMQIFYKDYRDLKKIVKRCGGKVKITKEIGNIVKIKRIKRRTSFCLGGFLFLGIIFFLSTRVWDIDINTEKNVTPFEIREVLSEMGIEQGIGKRAIDLYEVERNLETKCDEILWVRARLKGAVLKIDLKEKVNPPKFLEVEGGDIVAKMDGEIKRVYSQNGTVIVNPGDLVKEGDVLIKGATSLEEGAIEMEARGDVIANTFYTKEIEFIVDGEEMEKTGREEREIYVEVFGKKIYLKKFSKTFQNYDKIESNNGIIKKITYYEKAPKIIKLNREVEIKKKLRALEELLVKELPVDAKIVERKHQVVEGEKGKIKVIGEFAIEQNIAHR